MRLDPFVIPQQVRPRDSEGRATVQARAPKGSSGPSVRNRIVAVPLAQDVNLAPNTAEFVTARQEQVAKLLPYGALSEAAR